MSHPSALAGDGWCAVLLAALPVDHVAISTIGAPFETTVLAASDDLARSLSELQLDLGVGQSWDAAMSRHPVLIPRLPTVARWPTVMTTMADRGIGCSYAFPMVAGPHAIGAVDLYATAPDALTDRDVTAARGLTFSVTLEVLRDAVRYQDDRDAPAALNRRVVHQAVGMVMAQVGVIADDALLLIRGHAFAEGMSVRDVARDVVARRLTFAEDPS